MNKISKAPSRILLAAASIALMFGAAACNNNQAPAASDQNQPAQSDQAQDPAAAANLVPASAPVAGASNQPEPSDSDNDSDADDQDASYGQPALQAPDPPPELPEYSQPDCPGDGYLWTPRYWGFVGGRYHYHYGFWGRHIGYYGGVNY